MRSMVEGAYSHRPKRARNRKALNNPWLCPLRLASLATSPAQRGRNRSLAAELSATPGMH
jgi:hypothetical protein